jgi:UDPglucose 6-dehydrogenase
MMDECVQRTRRRIAVIGSGYVGLVTGACFAELGNSVVCLDNDSKKIAMLQKGNLPFYEPGLLELTIRNYYSGRLSYSEDVEQGIRNAEVVFIAVGTPMRADESADLSAIYDVAVAIGRALNEPKIVVLKSTVPVETCEFVAAIIAENAQNPHHVEVVSNPEFLREGSAVADFMQPDRVIIGTSGAKAEALMRELYSALDAPVLVTDVRTSEMIKYTANAFLATKISFMNEIANICELVGVDVKEVAAGISYDERIGARFMSPGLGYGGSCFPKDVLALERVAHGQSYDATLLRSVDAINRGQIGRAFAKIEKALGGSAKDKAACVLGLAFKPNTSDVREAPSLYLIDLMVRSGMRVKVHDPIATESARAKLGSDVLYCSNLYEAIDESDVLVLVTEWDEYQSINWKIARRLMRGNVVFDGRNTLDPNTVAENGLRYIGIGRSKEPVSTPSRGATAETVGDSAKAPRRSARTLSA